MRSHLNRESGCWTIPLLPSWGSQKRSRRSHKFHLKAISSTVSVWTELSVLSIHGPIFRRTRRYFLHGRLSHSATRSVPSAAPALQYSYAFLLDHKEVIVPDDDASAPDSLNGIVRNHIFFGLVHPSVQRYVLPLSFMDFEFKFIDTVVHEF